MEFLELAKARFSCKKMNGKAVEADKLALILEAGRVAPTAKNLQEQRIYVMQSAEALAKVDAVTPCRRGGSVVLVVAYDKNNVFTYPGGAVNSGTEDASIVATHMMLEAASIGVDSCWINFFDPAKAKEAFGLPENEEVVMMLDLGCRTEDEKGGPLPTHFACKPLEETVSYR